MNTPLAKLIVLVFLITSCQTPEIEETGFPYTEKEKLVNARNTITPFQNKY